MGFTAQSPCAGGGHTLSLGLIYSLSPSTAFSFPDLLLLVFPISGTGSFILPPSLGASLYVSFSHHPTTTTTTTHTLQMLSVICANPPAAPTLGWVLGEFRPSSLATLFPALPLQSVHLSEDKGIP